MQADKKNASVDSIESINSHIRHAEYAVRGELVIKAEEYRKQLLNGTDLPFNKIIAMNIGNPQQLGQKPLTYIRQVLSLCHYPDMLQDEIITSRFPEDMIRRANEYLAEMQSTGSYTHSQGLSLVRKQVASFIENRDGHATDFNRIFLTDGASAGVKQIISLLLQSSSDAVLCPIPQYPLYSATLTLLNGTFIGYNLTEQNGWSLDIDELKNIYDSYEGRLVGLAIINPGNPTGQCLDIDTIRAVVEFCEERRIVILADEVYQENIYSTIPFTSFRKVIKDTKSNAQLVSFHSGSKGVIGECGARAGYFHLTNFNQVIIDQLYKLASISLCSNVTGQLVMGLITSPPKEGDASYPLFKKERDAIFFSLQRRAVKLGAALNQMEHMSCQPIAGALYAFPSLTLSQKAIDAAKALNKSPDTFYALELLKNTGIVVVPGCGFQTIPFGGWSHSEPQISNVFHYRTTILPSEADMEIVIEKVKIFHKQFMDTYRD